MEPALQQRPRKLGVETQHPFYAMEQELGTKFGSATAKPQLQLENMKREHSYQKKFLI